MKNETKRDVFDDALVYVPVGREYDPVNDDEAGDLRSFLSARYAATLPDDLPVIPDYVAKYINYRKSSRCSIWEAMHDYFREDRVDNYIEDNSETFARAWLDGFQTED